MEPDREQEYHTVSMENHEAILIENLSHFFFKKAYVNVTLVCENQNFMAHQIILAAYSPYFDILLRLRSEHHPIIILNDVPKGDMLTLLKYMYQGTVDVPKTKLPSFLRLVKKFQIRGFEDEFLRRNETESTSSELKERLIENSEVRHQLLLRTLIPDRGKIELTDSESPVGTTIPMRRKLSSESKSNVINLFGKNCRSVDDSDWTFCKEDQAKPGPSRQEVSPPPTRNYDSYIEIIDSDIEIIDSDENNSEVITVDNQRDIESSPKWVRKTQPMIKRKLVESDDSAIGNLPKKRTGKDVIRDSEVMEDKEVRVNSVVLANKNDNVKSSCSVATEIDTAATATESNLPKKRTGKDVIRDSEVVEDKEVRVNPVVLTNKNGNVKSSCSVATEIDTAAIANRLLKRKRYNKSYSVEESSLLLKISFNKVRNYCFLCRKFQKGQTTHIKKYHNIIPRRRSVMCRTCPKIFFRDDFLKLHNCEF